MMLLGTVFGLLVLAAIGIAIWWLVRQWRPAPSDTALDLLRQRYARGEMTQEEFESRRRDLVA
jgi:uncharacterized membrane protein